MHRGTSLSFQFSISLSAKHWEPASKILLSVLSSSALSACTANCRFQVLIQGQYNISRYKDSVRFSLLYTEWLVPNTVLLEQHTRSVVAFKWPASSPSSV
jgi:hypothetical protein